MQEMSTPKTISEIRSYTLEELLLVEAEREGITYYSLSSEDEDYVGGFEIARFTVRDYDNHDPELRVRWITPNGFGNAPSTAGAYIEGIEKAVMGEDFVVDDVYGCVGTPFVAFAEASLSHSPDLGDFEALCQDAYKSGAEEVTMFSYRWPGHGEVPRGEMWLANERLTVRSHVDIATLGKDGITAMVNLFSSTALYPEYTHDFTAVLTQVLDGQSDK